MGMHEFGKARFGAYVPVRQSRRAGARASACARLGLTLLVILGVFYVFVLKRPASVVEYESSARVNSLVDTLPLDDGSATMGKDGIFHFLGGPSLSPTDNAKIDYERLDYLLDKGEVALTTREIYLDICRRSWNGISFSNGNKPMLVQGIRRFAFCYLSRNADAYLKDYDDMISIQEPLERALFPWLGGAFTADTPKTARYVLNDGTGSNTIHDSLDLVIARAVRETQQSSKVPKHKLTAKIIRDNLRGRGIVMTIADSMVGMAQGFVNTLIELNCTLPIEIFFRNDLRVNSFQKLYKTTRKYGGKVTAINMDNYIAEGWEQRVDHFNNKPMALILSQFEEVFYVDADAVPLIKPELFFEKGPYKRTGMFMFADRSLNWPLLETSANYLATLFPKGNTGTEQAARADSLVFDENEEYSFAVTNKTLTTPFFKKHVSNFVEAGLFLVHKRSHLPGILLTLNILLWAEVSTMFHGDKEAFWLAQSMVGNENYEVNQLPAFGIGKIERLVLSTANGNVPADRVCSTHPAHVDSESLELLWINSGFQSCKFDDDSSRSAKEVTFKFDAMLAIDDNQPGSFWQMELACRGYMWCAIQNVDLRSDKGYRLFTEEERAKYENLAEIWVDGSRE